MVFLTNYSKNRIFLFTIFLILSILASPILIMSNQITFTMDANDENLAEVFNTQIPKKSDTFYEETLGEAYDICVEGDYAYVVSFEEGLAIIDISDPTNPGTPVYEDTTEEAFGVYVKGDYVYAAVGQSG